MSILTQYDIRKLISHNFGNKKDVERSMEKAIRIDWPNRANKTARSRIRSVVNIIKELRSK